jgi:hypothetical protein
VSAYNFFFLNMFYTHKHSNSAVKHPFNYVSKVIFAPLAGFEMRVTQIFLLFFRNSCFYVYRHSDFEGTCSNGAKTKHVNVVVACGPFRVKRSDIGLHDLKRLREGIVERMMRVLGRSGPRCFHSGLVSGVGCGE